MLFKRQKLLLALLAANDGKLDKVNFQKLLFLYCKTRESEPTYEFVPHKRGCYSFTSHADKAKLMKKGYLAHSESWVLTSEGLKASRLPSPERQKVATFSAKHKSLRGNELIAHSYMQFPFWATRSQIAPQILGNNQNALKSIDSHRPQLTNHNLFTIGYEGKTLEGYLNQLYKAGVTLLCDVRKNPLSRKFGFSKGVLSESCRELGLKYEHLPQLGIESGARRTLDTDADYQRLFDKYDRTTLKEELAALDQIAMWIRDGEKVALTCFEHTSSCCHRSRVAKSIASTLKIEIVHL